MENKSLHISVVLDNNIAKEDKEIYTCSESIKLINYERTIFKLRSKINYFNITLMKK